MKMIFIFIFGVSMRLLVTALLAPALFVAAGLVPAALANERALTYTYDSRVLPVGARELEVWTTFQPMTGMLHMQERVEFEFAVTNRLMSAFYLNASAEMGETRFDGVSSEWKLNVLSRDVAPVGLAVYGEVGVGTEEVELEAKIIVDKELGRVLVAYNAVGELEFEDDEREWIMEHDLGVSVRFGRGSIGVEARNHTEVPESIGFEHTAFFVGPTLAWAGEGWWGAATVLPQVYAIHDAPGLVLDEHAHFEVRALLGFPF